MTTPEALKTESLQAGRRLLALQREKNTRDSLRDCFRWLRSSTKTIDEQDPANPLKPFPDRPYFEPLFELFEAEPTVFIRKSRTMMATWGVSAWAAHQGFNRPHTGVIFQSRDELPAIDMVKMVKALWINSPPELQKRWPLSKPLAKQPENRFELQNGSWFMGIVGDPAKLRHFHPTMVVFDEAAYMGNFDLNYAAACGTQCNKIIGLSSAENGPYWDMTNVKFDPWPAGPIKGLSFGRTAKGAAVVRLHWTADPTMRGERLAAVHRRFEKEADWAKEMEMDAQAYQGSLIYPEFDENIHVVAPRMVPPRGCRYMAIDPHPRTPHAFLWVLVDPWNDWYVYRELWRSIVCGQSRTLKDDEPDHQYTVREYAEAVAVLERNALEFRDPQTANEYALYREQPDGERLIARLMDQAGKGFRASGESDHRIESYKDRYETYGIYCQDPKKSHHAGEDAIHQLLAPRRHEAFGEWPRLHISSECPETIWEFRNHRYQRTRTVTSDRDLKQDAAPARCHMMDLLRYLATSRADYIERLVS